MPVPPSSSSTFSVVRRLPLSSETVSSSEAFTTNRSADGIAEKSKMSIPSPESAPASSAIESVPQADSNRYTSSPAPPANASFPPPPRMRLSRLFPVSVSACAVPIRLSIASPEPSVSLKPLDTVCSCVLDKSTVAPEDRSEKSSVSIPPTVSSMDQLPKSPAEKR